MTTTTIESEYISKVYKREIVTTGREIPSFSIK